MKGVARMDTIKKQLKHKHGKMVQTRESEMTDSALQREKEKTHQVQSKK